MGDKEYDNNNQGALFKNDKKNNAKQNRLIILAKNAVQNSLLVFISFP